MSEKLPTRGECLELLRKHNPENVVEHCLVVNRVAMFLGGKLAEKGEKVDLELLDRASLLHDVGKIKGLDGSHGEIDAEILRKKGYGREIVEIARKHVLHAILSERFESWEEKLVYYADKRVVHNKVVSLEEKMDYLEENYGKKGAKILESIRKSRPLVLELENEIFSKLGISPELEGLSE